MKISELLEVRINARQAIPHIVNSGYTAASRRLNVPVEMLKRFASPEKVLIEMGLQFRVDASGLYPVWEPVGQYERDTEGYSQDAVAAILFDDEHEHVAMDCEFDGRPGIMKIIVTTKAHPGGDRDAEGYSVLGWDPVGGTDELEDVEDLAAGKQYATRAFRKMVMGLFKAMK